MDDPQAATASHKNPPYAVGPTLSSSAWVAIWLFLGLPVAWSQTTPAEPPQPEKPPQEVREAEFFRTRVEPLLVRRCLQCHGSEHKGGLDLRTRASALKGGESGDAIVPGKPDASLVWEYVSDGEMPPKQPLSKEEADVLRTWIERGAFFPDKPLDPFSATTDERAGYDWWSLRPLASAKPPAPDAIPDEWSHWRAHPIDRFIFAKLQEKGLLPNPPASPRLLVRRLYYDLTGLPPSPEELRRWTKRLADPSESETAYRELVDRLLASPRYGEHWGRHWLDVIRFGESTGFERNVIIDNLWPFRDYVIRSFNEDKPFRQLVLEHLAGDVLAPDDPQTAVGTAFLVCGPYDNVGNQDPVQRAQIRANTIDEIIRTTGEAFLGLTIGCGRCHNHKFDPITQQDYYSWYATFAGVQHGNREMATAEQRRERQAKLRPLQEKQQHLSKEKAALVQAITARAEKSAANVEATWTRPAPDRRQTIESFAPRPARFVRLICEATDTNPSARTGFRIDEFEVWTSGPDPRNVALARSGAKAEGASRIARDFADAYAARLAIDGDITTAWLAAGPILTITLPEVETIDRVIFSSDRTGAAGSHPVATFVGEYRIEVSLDGQDWTEVASSRDRKPVREAHRRRRLFEATITPEERQRLGQLDHELAEVASQIAAIPPLPSWWVGRFQEAKGPFHVFLGGSPQRPGEEVVPHSLAALSPTAGSYRLAKDAPESARRLALAKWIVAETNPLTPRVLANRLWHYHFGRGIVETPSDFGFMGSRPSHPLLLDWLARQVHSHGWRLKPLHRLIVTSQTYRQASSFRSDAARVDADSRLLWRFPPRRLAAEEIRDTILAVAGKLDLRMGGPGFRLYRYLQDNVATYEPLDEVGPETYRRAVYHQNARAAPVDLLADFDIPDCAFATPRRSSTTTPLQALTMMNHRFTLDMAEALSQRLAKEASELDDQIRQGFLLCYGRTPDKSELEACRQLAKKHGLRAVCRVWLNSNELVFVE